MKEDRGRKKKIGWHYSKTWPDDSEVSFCVLNFLGPHNFWLDHASSLNPFHLWNFREGQHHQGGSTHLGGPIVNCLGNDSAHMVSGRGHVPQHNGTLNGCPPDPGWSLPHHRHLQGSTHTTCPRLYWVYGHLYLKTYSGFRKKLKNTNQWMEKRMDFANKTNLTKRTSELNQPNKHRQTHHSWHYWISWFLITHL